MKKVFVPFIMLLIVVILVGVSLLGFGGESGGSTSGGLTTAAQATATFGAGQLHLQLTAIAEQEQTCPPGSPCQTQP